MSADEISEYIDKFNFWIDTRETSDDKAIKGAFLTAVGKEAFTLLKTLENEGDPIFLKRRILGYGLREPVCNIKELDSRRTL